MFIKVEQITPHGNYMVCINTDYISMANPAGKLTYIIVEGQPMIINMDFDYWCGWINKWIANSPANLNGHPT